MIFFVFLEQNFKTLLPFKEKDDIIPFGTVFQTFSFNHIYEDLNLLIDEVSYFLITISKDIKNEVFLSNFPVDVFQWVDLMILFSL